LIPSLYPHSTSHYYPPLSYPHLSSFLFFFNDTATTEIYTLSLHDALPIWLMRFDAVAVDTVWSAGPYPQPPGAIRSANGRIYVQDRKSTRLNSSHDQISYAVFCLKKKKKKKKK